MRWFVVPLRRDLALNGVFLIVGALVTAVFAWGPAAVDRMTSRPAVVTWDANVGILTPLYPWPDGQFHNILVSGNEGLGAFDHAQYAHVLVINNTGNRDLYNLKVHLRLPGTPFLAWSSDKNAGKTIGAPNVTLLSRTGPDDMHPTVQSDLRDPDSINASDLPLSVQTLQWSNASDSSFAAWAPRTDSYAWTQNVAGARGTEGGQTVEFTLTKLAHGTEWRIATLYFGTLRDADAGGYILASEGDPGAPVVTVRELGVFQSPQHGDPPTRFAAWP